MKRVANKDCRALVVKRIPFKGSNLYAEDLCRVRYDDGDRVHYSASVEPDDERVIERWYVVYSYGGHFPIYIYAGGHWYANRDKFSQSTTRHQAQARPEYDGSRMTWLSGNEMQHLSSGMVQYLRRTVSMKEVA